MNWKNQKNWGQSSRNTFWCLVGCSVGDFGTIAYVQWQEIEMPMRNLMILAMSNGILTSILLETLILLRQMDFGRALRTAMGMSLISMLVMELAMNLVDYYGNGGTLGISIWVVPAIIAGFLTAWPYNYWRLERLGKSCCGG